MPRKHVPELAALSDRVASSRGRAYWRSLDELAETDEFLEFLHREFPEQASQWTDAPSRREFLKVMGASLALAGLAGCTAEKPAEKIVPYVRMPEEILPGKPLYYATADPHVRHGLGLVVETHMGRPTKIEGNPAHPASRGATDAFAQAAVLGLYDPDRSQTVRRRGRIRTRNDFTRTLHGQVERLHDTNGRGLRILVEPVRSPTLQAQLERLLEAYPAARVHEWEPVFTDFADAGARLAFGDDAPPVEAIYHFDKADVVLSLDADFLASGSWPVVYARDFMQRRRVADDLSGGAERLDMNRLYALETTPTLTGAKADHRLARRSDEVTAFAFDLARALGIDVDRPADLPENVVPNVWLTQLARDLRDYRHEGADGGALVVAGDHLPPVVHALAHAINAELGSFGNTISLVEPATTTPHADDEPRSALESLEALVDEMRDGEVEQLFVLGGNPVFDAPADFAFAEALKRVRFSVHLSLHHDETSRTCTWHLPAAHFLESWSDVRAFDGTASVIQPMIEPVYGDWTMHRLVDHLLGEESRTDYGLVRDFWRERSGVEDGDAFDEWWHEVLHRGVIPNTDAERRELSVRGDFAAAIDDAWEDWREDHVTRGDGEFEVVFQPDPSVWDGRFANNGWLQELPKPFTKLTWDNAALVSRRMAEAAGLENGDLIELAHGDRTLTMPVWILPGQPEHTIRLHFGYGRAGVGRVADGAGFNVYPFRTSDAPWFLKGVKVRRVDGEYPLATTVHHHLVNPLDLEERHLVRDGTLHELREHPEHPPFVHPVHHPWEGEPPSPYPDWDYEDDDPQHTFKWGMVIDQTACTGCSACVVACQSENNIPVVGKREVARGREMHWLRIDAYYKGDLDEPEGPYHQPLPCMHCEKAPCEVVCPVAATTHSEEGLNEMTYNRCVGTRYCSNNCPYKVRRFNFFDYNQPIEDTPELHLLENPDVTVRSSGVMEKCTYCVQRLNSARIDAKTGEVEAEEVDVQTACQQACPTEAIRFGDLNAGDAPRRELASAKELQKNPLQYALLDELGTRPRTTYLAVVRNPNPEIERAGMTNVE